MNLWNNTRLWILKGHTPLNLRQEEKKHLQPLPAAPFAAHSVKAEVIDLKTRKKVGRNDPCPCGSGKKLSIVVVRIKEETLKHKMQQDLLNI